MDQDSISDYLYRNLMSLRSNSNTVPIYEDKPMQFIREMVTYYDYIIGDSYTDLLLRADQNPRLHKDFSYMINLLTDYLMEPTDFNAANIEVYTETLDMERRLYREGGRTKDSIVKQLPSGSRTLTSKGVLKLLFKNLSPKTILIVLGALSKLGE